MIGKAEAEAVRPVAGRIPRPASQGQSARAAHTTILSILLVDDRDADAERLAAALRACRDFDVEIDHVSDAAEARRRWDAGGHDLAIFDVWLGRGTSVGLLAAFADDATARPVVVLTNLPHAEARAMSADSCALLVHGKDNLSPGALAMTLGSALALSRRLAVTLDA